MASDAGEQHSSRNGDLLAWAIPLLIYVAFVVPAAIHNRELLQPDAVAYIRRALYITRGEFAASVSGYWSPLLSWSIAPFIAVGVEPVYAARGALATWGAAFIIAVGLFLRVMTPLNWRWRGAMLSVLAVAATVHAMRQITPDLPLAVCLFCYFAAAVSPRLLVSKRWQLLTGALGGIAFLAKSYALPFLALHIPLTIALRWLDARRSLRPSRDQRPSDGNEMETRASPFCLRRAMAALAMVVAGVALVAGPWIGLLSARYGNLTISTSAVVARSAIAPPAKIAGQYSLKNSLRWATPPQDPYISQIENPDECEYPLWSPFDSRAAMDHQIAIIRWHARKAVYFIRLFDHAWLGPATLAFSLVTIFGWLHLRGLKRWRVAWIVGTLAAYCSGFLFVYFDRRYIDSVALPLVLTLCLWTFHSLLRTRRDPWYVWIPRGFLMLGVLVSFAWALKPDLRELFHRQTTVIYREIADLMRVEQLVGPIACTDRYVGMYLALHLGEKQQSILPIDPKVKKNHALEKALLAGKPGAIVVWWDRGEDKTRLYPSHEYGRALVKRLGWVRRFRVTKWGRRAEVFGPPRATTTTAPQGASAPTTARQRSRETPAGEAASLNLSESSRNAAFSPETH